MGGRWWPVRRAGGWAPWSVTATLAVGRRRSDAAAALAWATPVSGARCLALAAYVRALGDRQLHQLLTALPRQRFDQLVDAAFQPEGTAA